MSTPRGQKNVTGALKKAPAGSKCKGGGPPKTGAFSQSKDQTPSTFKKFYDRGDLPVAVDNYAKGCKLMWKVEIEMMDYHHYLPIFFDGLREKSEPQASIARQGVDDLLSHGGTRILPVVPQLIIPIKLALTTRDPKVIVVTLHAIQHLVRAGEMIGEALVAYYRQILPIFNLFKNKNVNIGDSIEYGQHKNENVGDLIDETLQMLETYGGQDAFINIKYMIPTYESCILR